LILTEKKALLGKKASFFGWVSMPSCLGNCWLVYSAFFAVFAFLGLAMDMEVATSFSPLLLYMTVTLAASFLQPA
jgi:hypothetical protein